MERWDHDGRVLSTNPLNSSLHDGCGLFLHLLAGLETMHALGVYHGDVKPMNFLVNGARTQAAWCDVGYKYTAGTSKYRSPGRTGENLGSSFDDWHAFVICVKESWMGPLLEDKLSRIDLTGQHYLEDLKNVLSDNVTPLPPALYG